MMNIANNFIFTEVFTFNDCTIQIASPIRAKSTRELGVSPPARKSGLLMQCRVPELLCRYAFEPVYQISGSRPSYLNNAEKPNAVNECPFDMKYTVV
jgi:hypothetical protein